MATEIIMPKAGMAMEEGTVVKWLKEEGDEIKKGEAILEIHTDKVNMEVEAELGGILLKKIANEGDVLPVFTVLGYIGKEGEKVPEKNEESNEKIVEAKESIKESVTESNDEAKDSGEVIPEDDFKDKVRATPAARKLCREKGIDIATVRGTGPKGRVHVKDVQNHEGTSKALAAKITPLAEKIAKDKGVDISKLMGSGIDGKIMKSDVMKSIEAPKAQRVDVDSNAGKIIPMSPMRKVIAQRMSESYFTAPTFTLNIDVDMTKVMAIRREIKDTVLEETGCKLTITDFIILAASKALQKHPMVNASLVEEGILLHEDVNIALAVGLDEGLLVPVIKKVQDKSLSQIAKETKDIAQRAKSGKLSPSEMEGSTFTISNLGMYGITHFNPIINQPNSAILGVGTITKKMVVVNDEPQIRPIMTLSLTIDHRVVDGAPGAKFLKFIKTLLENPMNMFI